MTIPYHPLSADTAHVVHFIFEWLGVATGVQLYRWLKKSEAKKRPRLPNNPQNNDIFAVVVGCILGAGIFNKLLFVLEVPQAWEQYGWASLALGQTIVGGIIGGMLGVEIAKKIVGVKHSTGDLFVMPFCVGLIVGRIGCFLAGLHDGTYGMSTSLPWGMDFGDGVLRHPTQIYDMLWCVAMLILVKINYYKWQAVSGLTFKVMFAGYLLWRLLVDGIKPVPYPYLFGWSAIQWACLTVLMGYLPFLVRDFRRLTRLNLTKNTF